MESIKELTSQEDWRNVWKRSMNSPVLVYKHSTSCLISARAFKQLKAFHKAGEDQIHCCMVKVIENRSVSNEIAKDTSISHKSPQILLIDQQEVVWNTSHWKITEKRIRKAVGP
ncbi:bacillithiol system redox-active protein YtxJ [Halobacillus halophilus]|uniref:bacillithiol system redox-active protein YtxJ n=1 Tax=Halobacillus halophilus TaxID=1570 RepID=UPI001CD35704|nr:bacillithiol system redox-active protein YtxJ [Halobacillus halophilus]MCA1010652.1 bacillithiol system redox-active protein YtxJ [Halobacillus halophilus]